MGEGVRHNIALAASLQSVITNCRRRLQGCLHITGLEEPPLFLGVVSPHPGQAVGLQLDANLKLIGLDLIHTALRLLHLRQDSKQVLHVVTDLVRDHIGLGKLAALTADVTTVESSLEVLKERRIQINLAIDGTVERPMADWATPHPERVPPENMTSVGGS